MQQGDSLYRVFFWERRMLANRISIERKKFNVWITALIVTVAVVVIGFSTYTIARTIGKHTLTKVESDALVTKEYKGKTYYLNEDLVSVLLMGIDNETVEEVGGKSWTAEEGSQIAGGQADALFLAIMNPHKKKLSLLSINRNTMTDVDVFDENGNYLGIYKEQICLQHGYGDGKEQSCERQVKTVSRMLDDVPINAYAAISMDAIPALNDAIGGVTVVALDELVYPEYNVEFHEGETYDLKGIDAYWYLRLRHEDEFDSATKRLARQKQYIANFAAKAKEQATADFRVALDLYQTASKYMVTDVTPSQFTYMASEAIGYDFGEDSLRYIEGETMDGSSGFEEFYADEEKLEETIVDLFYEEKD